MTAVLFVNTATRPPLGADTWIHLQIMRALDRSDHEVHVACNPGRPGRTTPTFDAVRMIPDVRMVPVDLGPERGGRSPVDTFKALVATIPAFAGLVRLVVHVRRHRITIVHTSDRPRDAFTCVLLSRLTRARCIIHVHVGYDPTWMGRMLRWSLAHGDDLVAISDHVAASLVAGGLDPRRVHVVLNAIDVERWTPGRHRSTVREEFGIAADAPVVVTVCRLFPEKGPGELIRALGVLRPQRPDVTLLIVGQELRPGYVDELTALAAREGLGHAVHFLGRRNDVADVMAAADVFAMPSIGEPFGLVFLEAMAMELPVVALASGGTVEVVEHGVTGLLTPPGDTAALADALRLLVGDPGLRAEMGRRGRDRVVSRFTIARMARDMARVYSLVASCTPRRAGRREKRHAQRLDD